ncbi:hypothetical protein D9M68_905540 [compost metagenome]
MTAIFGGHRSRHIAAVDQEALPRQPVSCGAALRRASRGRVAVGSDKPPHLVAIGFIFRAVAQVHRSALHRRGVMGEDDLHAATVMLVGDRVVDLREGVGGGDAIDRQAPRHE